MNEIRLDASPRALARAEGVVYLAFIGEATFCLWLLIKGLNVEKWNERYPRTS